MVELRLYTAVTAVRFCQEAPTYLGGVMAAQQSPKLFVGVRVPPGMPEEAGSYSFRQHKEITCPIYL